MAVRTAPARVERRLARIARSGKQIVAGPWLSEVGIELLFWIPMLRWFQRRFGVPRERIVAVSRGGADLWYGDVAATYFDVHERFGPELTLQWAEERVRATGIVKQRRIGEDDRAVLTWLASERMEGGYELLHPSMMFDLFAPFWAADSRFCRLATVLDRTVYAPIHKPEPLPGLPDVYVVVKAYFNNLFPETPVNRAFLADLLAGLVERTHVVLLSTGMRLDDHAELAAEDGRLVTLAGSMTARNNLDVQTRAITGAKAFIGIQGGFSYLASMLGVPSFNLHANEDFIPTHRDVMLRALRAIEVDGLGTGCVTLPAPSAKTLVELVL